MRQLTAFIIDPEHSSCRILSKKKREWMKQLINQLQGKVKDDIVDSASLSGFKIR